MPSRKMCQEQQNGSESGMEERERSRKRSSGEGVELAEWVTHKRSQLRPQRFIVVIYLPSLLLIFTPHTVYKVLHSLCLLLFLYLPLSTYFSLSFPLCVLVRPSVWHAHSLFIYSFSNLLMFVWPNTDRQTNRQTDSETDKLKHWNRKRSLPIEQMLRWLAAADNSREAHKKPS